MKTSKYLILILLANYSQSITAQPTELASRMQIFKGVALEETFQDGTVINMSIRNAPSFSYMQGSARAYLFIVESLKSLKTTHPAFYTNYTTLIAHSWTQGGLSQSERMKYEELKPHPVLQNTLGYDSMIHHAIQYNIPE